MGLDSAGAGFKCNIHGISPFSPVGDTVSSYIDRIDYYEDVTTNFDYFSLSSPQLHRGLSSDSNMTEVIRSKQWDCIYIDGSHDYAVVKNDFVECSACLLGDY